MSRENTANFATLEVEAGRGAEVVGPYTYTDYWRQFAEQHELTDKTDIKKTRDLGSYVARLTNHVIRGVDPFCVALMHDIRTDLPQEQTIGNAVAEWDRTLGSRNSLDDAQGDLLRAAGLLMYSNFLGDPEEFGLPTTGSTEVYERFMSLVDNNSLEHQRPGSELLLAGQLVHKAAWKEQDPHRQEDLFKTAVDVYTRIYDDPNAVWADRLTAGRYRSDIYFQWVDDEMRAAVKAGDKDAQESLHDIAVNLLEEMATDLTQAGRLVDQADLAHEAVGGLKGFEWAGFMLDSFALLEARELFYLGLKPEVAVLYGIRSALSHEDQPRTLKLKPKSSFDIVVQRWSRAGTIVDTTQLQFKLLSHKHEPRVGDREEDYEGVIYIGVKNLSTAKMMRAVDDKLFRYANQELLKGAGPLSRLKDLFNSGIQDKFVSTSV